MDEKIEEIYLLLDNKAVKAALLKIESAALEINEGEIGDEAHNLLVSYEMMISYIMQGIKDPNMHDMIRKSLAHAYNITERIALIKRHKNSDSTISKINKAISSEYIPLDKIQKKLENYTENIGTADLIYSPDDIDDKKLDLSKEHEEVVNYMFNKTYASLRWSETDHIQAKELMSSLLITDEDKAIFLSAITMSLLHVFDDKKFLLLISSYNNESALISARALVGVVIILQINSKCINFYPEILAQLSILKDDKRVVKDLRNIQLQFLMTRETDNFDKKIREGIMEDVMKVKRDSEDIDDTDGENPDWEKIKYDSGFSDKLMEINELQSSGADIYMHSFAPLKKYGFFFKISHWFYPFFTYQSDIFPIINRMKNEEIPFIDIMIKSVFFCNLDKYSLCFTFQSIPASQKEQFLSQFSELNENYSDKNEIIKLFEEESKRSDIISRLYIQDLYRFFKLWNYKNEENDIFNDKFDLWNNPYLCDLLSDEETLKQIGSFLIKYDYLQEAQQIYQLMNITIPEDAESWQKTGFILQKLSRCEEAIRCYLRADMLVPEQKWTNLHLAQCYKKIGEYTKAIEYYKIIEELNPENLNIDIQIGQCFIKLEKYKEAQQYFYKVIYIDENNINALRALGWCLAQTGNYDEAKKYFSLVIGEDKANAYDYINLGHVNIIQGNIVDAINNYRIGAVLIFDKEKIFKTIDESKVFLRSHGVSEDYISILTDLII